MMNKRIQKVNVYVLYDHLKNYLPMKKYFLFLSFIICYYSNSFTQFFDWAASASGIDLRYQYSSVDKDNNIVVGGESSRNWTHTSRGVEAEIYDSKGVKRDSLYLEDESSVVISYSSEGTINWHLVFDKRFSKLLGITHNYLNQTVLLVQTDDRFSSSDNLGRIPEIEDGYDIPNGYYLLFYDKKGKFIKKTQVLIGNEAEIDFSGFQSYPKGGFVFTGFVEPGKVCDSISRVAGPGGGDLLLVVNEDGSPKWADVVSYEKQSCCSYSSDMCKAVIAKDGTIFLAGSYQFGATFGQNMKMTSTTDSGSKYEVYLASYSKSGSLNWVNTSKTNSIFSAITANNKGVFIAYRTYKEGNYAFDLKIDTLGGRNWLITGFNFKGKALWTTSSKVKSINTIVSDQNSNLYIAGENGWNGLIGTDTLTKQLDALIASFTFDGEYRWSKLTTIPITTSNESLNLFLDNCGNIFMVGTLWFSLPGELSVWDKAFVKGSGYGAAPFITRFKNTIPDREGVEDFCQISPGPWKIYNYPNPFVDRTKIEFILSYDDYISLKVYTINGALITVLIDNKKYESGKHVIDFSQELPFGAYVVVLTGTEMVESCKILVGK